MKRFYIKKIHVLISALIFTVWFTSCGEDVWDDIPDPIVSFINRYFPNVGISSYSDSNNGYYIEIRNDASLRFNSLYSWININGNGTPLPSVLIFDQLPQKAYEYLEETEQVGQVYSLSRDSVAYTIGLYDTSIRYDINSRTITGL